MSTSPLNCAGPPKPNDVPATQICRLPYRASHKDETCICLCHSEMLDSKLMQAAAKHTSNAIILNKFLSLIIQLRGCFYSPHNRLCKPCGLHHSFQHVNARKCTCHPWTSWMWCWHHWNFKKCASIFTTTARSPGSGEGIRCHRLGINMTVPVEGVACKQTQHDPRQPIIMLVWWNFNLVTLFPPIKLSTL